jgi:hypothetical protein
MIATDTVISNPSETAAKKLPDFNTNVTRLRILSETLRFQSS